MLCQGYLPLSSAVICYIIVTLSFWEPMWDPGTCFWPSEGLEGDNNLASTEEWTAGTNGTWKFKDSQIRGLPENKLEIYFEDSVYSWATWGETA